jgi:hypothetical protein
MKGRKIGKPKFIARFKKKIYEKICQKRLKF